MSEDERPGNGDAQDEPAVFAALGGELAWDDFMRLPGSGALVQQTALLLDGDTAAAEGVLQDSFTALQETRSHPDDPGAHVRLLRSAVSESRQRPAGAPGTAGDAATRALLALPRRQREAIVLHDYMGLTGADAAEVMRISAGAFKAHLARGTSSLS